VEGAHLRGRGLGLEVAEGSLGLLKVGYRRVFSFRLLDAATPPMHVRGIKVVLLLEYAAHPDSGRLLIFGDAKPAAASDQPDCEYRSRSASCSGLAVMVGSTSSAACGGLTASVNPSEIGDCVGLRLGVKPLRVRGEHSRQLTTPINAAQ
jgi:hypothetical protein